MLVITRKEGEAIVLDGGIEIVVISLEKSQVRLGFGAPSSVRIYRKEIIERIQQANREAALPKASIRLPKIEG